MLRCTDDAQDRVQRTEEALIALDHHLASLRDLTGLLQHGAEELPLRSADRGKQRATQGF